MADLELIEKQILEAIQKLPTTHPVQRAANCIIGVSYKCLCEIEKSNRTRWVQHALAWFFEAWPGATLAVWHLADLDSRSDLPAVLLTPTHLLGK